MAAAAVVIPSPTGVDVKAAPGSAPVSPTAPLPGSPGASPTYLHPVLTAPSIRIGGALVHPGGGPSSPVTPVSPPSHSPSGQGAGAGAGAAEPEHEEYWVVGEDGKQHVTTDAAALKQVVAGEQHAREVERHAIEHQIDVSRDVFGGYAEWLPLCKLISSAEVQNTHDAAATKHAHALAMDAWVKANPILNWIFHHNSPAPTAPGPAHGAGSGSDGKGGAAPGTRDSAPNSHTPSFNLSKVPPQWDAELKEKRKAYYYVYDGVLPPHMPDALPKAENWSTVSLFGFLGVFRSLMDKAVPDMDWRRPYASLSEWPDRPLEERNPFKQNLTRGFTIASTNADWWTDEWFGEQRLSGINPAHPRRATPPVPEGFTAPAAEIDAALRETVRPSTPDRQVTYDSEQKGGRLYLLDYALLEMPPMTQREREEEDTRTSPAVRDRWMPVPYVLLHYCETSHTLKPVAIQLFHAFDEKTDRVFYPAPLRLCKAEADWPWRYAKTCVQAADWNLHQLGAHLCWTHLVEEVCIVASHTELPSAHPVMVLLHSHFEKTLVLNRAARLQLVPNQINLLAGMSAFRCGHLISRLYAAFDFTERMLPNDLRARGIADYAKALPTYHYARAGMASWDATRHYVLGVLKKFYGRDEEGDATVAKDPYLQGWAAKIACMDEKKGGGKLKGFPSPIRTVAVLADALTMIIFTATVQHSSVNYQQYFYQGFVPNCPGSMYGPVPTKATEIDEKFLIRALPPKFLSHLSASLGWILSQPTNNSFLDGFDGSVAAKDVRIKPHLHELKLKLSAIVDAVEQLSRPKSVGGANRPDSIQLALNPRRLANSIEI